MKHVMFNNVIFPKLLPVTLIMRIVATLVTVLKRVVEEQNIVLEHAKTDNGVMQVVPVNNNIDTSHATLKHVVHRPKSVQILALVALVAEEVLKVALALATVAHGEVSVVLPNKNTSLNPVTLTHVSRK